jgi:hypothetical protein
VRSSTTSASSGKKSKSLKIDRKTTLTRMTRTLLEKRLLPRKEQKNQSSPQQERRRQKWK